MQNEVNSLGKPKMGNDVIPNEPLRKKSKRKNMEMPKTSTAMIITVILEIKTLIQHYTHSCIAKSVKDTGSLPDTSRMSAKGGVGHGVHSFVSGANFSGFTFKEGKTSIVDMNAIFKMEKGADALRRLQSGAGSTGRAKVVGGPKSRQGQGQVRIRNRLHC
jgi:hypothetical protein